jgi:hypothetical protein
MSLLPEFAAARVASGFFPFFLAWMGREKFKL